MVEADLRAVEDVLAEMLDILAEMKANQNAMRMEPGELGGAEPLPADPPLLRAQETVIARWRGLRRTGAGQLMKTLFTDADEATTDRGEVAFWKAMGRTAITGMVVLTTFLLGLFQLLKHS